MTLSETVRLTPESRRRRTGRRIRHGAALVLVLGLGRLALEPDILFALVFLGGPLIPLLFVYFLMSVAGGRKSVVVYLRRFGLTPPGRAVTVALESGLSRRHRIVTLDDSRFPALEVPPWERRMSRYGPPLLAFALIAIFVMTVRTLRQQSNFLFLGLSAAAIPALTASLWLVLALFLLLMIHRMRIRRHARGGIASERDLGEWSRGLLRLNGWRRAPAISAPQAIVLRVDDSMWRRTVEVLVRDCGAALVDVSEPTANVAWELETVLRHAAARVVLVGERGAIARWSANGSSLNPELFDRVAALLKGRSILVYDQDRRGLRRFRRSLGRALDNVALGAPSVEPVDLKLPRQPWARVASGLRVAGTYLLAPVLATVLSYVAIKVTAPALVSLILDEYHPADRLGSPARELQNRDVPLTTSALVDAAWAGRHEDVRRLVEAGVSLQPAIVEGWSPLLLAARTGDPATLRSLLDAGADVERRTSDGRSPLMLAAAEGHMGAVQTLLDAGAAMNATTDGRTPLGFAVAGGHAETAQLLLGRGADASLRHLGMTPLTLAAALGQPDMIDLLLAGASDVNARTETGRTALALASIRGCLECVRALLAKDAGVDAVDVFSQTALSYAVFNRHTQIAALLEGAGARPGQRSSYQRSETALHGQNRTRPYATVAVAGDLGAHAPALVSAVTKVLATTTPRELFWSAERLEAARQDTNLGRGPGGLAPRGMVLKFSTDERDYALWLPASDADSRKAIISGLYRADLVILVVSPDMPDQSIEDQVRLAREAQVPDLVVAVDAARQQPHDPKLTKVQSALLRYGYTTAPVVALSASGALAGEAEWEQSIETLLDAVDRATPRRRSRDEPLLMVVEGTMPRPGNGAIVAVRVEAGVVRIGDAVEIVGLRSTRKTVVERIETFPKLLDEAAAGEDVGLTLEGVAREDVERGQVISTPGAVDSQTRFEAIVYLYGPDEGGRLAPVRNGYRPTFLIRTAAVTGFFRFPANTTIRPGRTATVAVDLLTPVALAPGVRFVVREGTAAVGVGIVTRVTASTPQILAQAR